MAYGGAGPGAQEGLFKAVLPTCEPGPDFEACERDLYIGTAGIALGVIAFIVLAGVACWLVFSGKGSLMLIELEQKIQRLRR